MSYENDEALQTLRRFFHLSYTIYGTLVLVPLLIALHVLPTFVSESVQLRLNCSAVQAAC